MLQVRAVKDVMEMMLSYLYILAGDPEHRQYMNRYRKGIHIICGTFGVDANELDIDRLL